MPTNAKDSDKTLSASREFELRNLAVQFGGLAATRYDIGTGTGAGVVDCVGVVLVVDICAAAILVTIERAIAVMSQVLIMSCSPRDYVRAETARCPVE
jgi:hypothetical protein